MQRRYLLCVVPVTLAFAPLLFGQASLHGDRDSWKNPTTERLDLKGPVRRFKLERIEALPDGSIDPASRRMLKQCSFDKSGRALECRNYSYEKKNALVERQVYRYDSQRRIEARDTYDGVVVFHKPQTVEYQLDDQGRRVGEKRIQSDGEPGDQFAWKYDERGNLEEEVWYAWNTKPDGPPTARTVYEYDEAGRLLTTRYLDSRPELSWETRNKLAGDGNILETETFAAGVLSVRQSFLYDERGRRTSATTEFFNNYGGMSHGPEAGRTTWRYDDAGHVVEEAVYDPSGTLVRVARFSFDQHGNQSGAEDYRTQGWQPSIGTIEVNGLKTIMKWSSGSPAVVYEYDDHGNWVRATHTRRSQFAIDSPRITSFIEERAIEYDR